MVRDFFQESGLCGEDVIAESLSPNSKYIATVFTGSCGATTPFFTHVNLRKNSEKNLPSENDMFDRGKVFFAESKPQIRLIWEDESKLIIEYSRVAHVTREDKWHDVIIHYKYID